MEIALHLLLSKLMAKAQDPSVPDSRCEGFMIPSFHGFVGDDECVGLL